jgi:serine phosphatase RsbU (regulator of sigma subunit)
LTEAQNGDGDEFGFERLVALAPQFVASTTSVEAGRADLLAMLRQELARFAGGRPLDDDLTLALVWRL